MKEILTIKKLFAKMCFKTQLLKKEAHENTLNNLISFSLWHKNMAKNVRGIVQVK